MERGPQQDAAVDAAGHVELPLEEAAARLGITPEALRKRLQRGKTITGYQRGGRWYAALPIELPPVAEASTEPRQVVSGMAGHDLPPPWQDTATDACSPRPDAEALAAYRQLVDQLQGEVAFLREQLGQRADELERRDVIIAELARRAPQLPATAGRDAPPAAPAATSGAEDHGHSVGDLRPVGRLKRAWRAWRGG